MKSALGLGLLAAMTTASLAQAQSASNGGNGEKPTTTTEASSFQEGMVTMAPGEGITFDAGDEFMLNLLTLLQINWAYASLDDPGDPSVQSFDIPRAQTYLRGHAFDPSVEYLLTLAWVDQDQVTPGSSTQVIRDGWVTYTFWENEESAIGVRAGQSRTYFGRQGTLFEGGYELPGPGQQVATRTFANLRSRGAWLMGEHNIASAISWTAGVQNGDVADHATGVAEFGEDTSNPDNELGFIGTVSYDTAEDLYGEWGSEADLMNREEVDWGVGAGVFAGNNRDAGNAFDVESTEWNVNGVLKTQGVAVSGEWFGREDDPQNGTASEDSDGWQVQASYTTAPASTQWGFVFGISQVKLDGDGTQTVNFMTGTDLAGNSGEILEWTLGVNAYYHEHKMKTQIAYVNQDIDFDNAGIFDPTNDIIILQFQLMF